jgi:hypothetical protein
MRSQQFRLEPDLGCIDPPIKSCRGFGGLRLWGDQQRILHDPAVQCHIIQSSTTLGQYLLKITIGHGITGIEKHQWSDPAIHPKGKRHR